MHLVCYTKALIQNLRENDWDKLIKKCNFFMWKTWHWGALVWGFLCSKARTPSSQKISYYSGALFWELKYSLLQLISNYKS